MRTIASLTVLSILLGTALSCSEGDFDGAFGKPGPEQPPRLTLTEGTYNPTYRQIDKTASEVEILQLHLLSEVSNVEVTSMSFTYTGTAPLSAVTSVKLYEDAFGDGLYNTASPDPILGTIVTPTSDTFTFSGLSKVIDTTQPRDWLLVFDLSGSGSDGQNVSARFDGATAIAAQGETSVLPVTVAATTVNGGVVTLISVGSLTVAAGASNPTSQSIAGTETHLAVLQVALSAGSVEDVDVKRLTLTHGGSGNVASISAVRLWRDLDNSGTYSAGDTQIGTDQVYTIATGKVTFELTASPETIAASATVNWVVTYAFSTTTPPAVGSNFSASFSTNSEMIAEGGLSGQAIYPVGAPISGGTMDIPIGTLTVAAGAAMPGGGTVTPPVSQAVIQLTLTAGSAEAVDIASITFTDTGSGTPTSPNINQVHLVLDNGTTAGQLDLSDAILQTPLTFIGNSVTATFSTPRTLAAGASEDWILVYDFGSGGTGSFRSQIDVTTQLSATGGSSGSAITPSGGTIQGNTFTLPGSVALPTTWAALSPSGTNPGNLVYHSAVFDPANVRVVFFGGTNSASVAGGAQNTAYGLSVTTVGGEAWSTLSPSGTPPQARYGHLACYDSTAQRMIVIGGYDNTSPLAVPLSDVHAMTTGTVGSEAWSAIVPTGTGPSGLAQASAVYDATGNRVIVWGGLDGSYTPQSQVYILTLGGTPAWSTPSYPNTPTARYGHVAAWDPSLNGMMIFGGYNGSTYLQDTHFLDFNTNQWNAITIASPPAARAEMGFGHDTISRRFYIFGGADSGSTWRQDVHYFDFASSSWSSLSTSGTAPSSRQGPAGAFETTNSRLILHGGGQMNLSNPPLSDIHELR